MTDIDVIPTAKHLRTRSPCRLWGVSAASIYTALAAKGADDPVRERLVSYVRAETLRTNDECDREAVVAMHDWLLEALGVTVDDDVTLLGSFILASEEPLSLIRAVATEQFRTAETVLRSCSEIEESLPRREFDSLLADEWTEIVLGPLLGSLGFVTSYPDSVEPHHDRINAALMAQREASVDRAVATAYAHIIPVLTGIEDETCIENVSIRVAGDVPEKGLTPASVAATLAYESSRTVDTEAIADAVHQLREQHEEQFERLRVLLSPTTDHEVTIESAPHPVEVPSKADHGRVTDEEATVIRDVLKTVAEHPEFARLDLDFVTKRLSRNSYEVYQLFTAVPSVDCYVADDVELRFDAVPANIDGESLQREYVDHLVDRCATTRSQIQELTDVSVSAVPPARKVDELIVRAYESLDEGAIAPTYFTYTLVDPEALGEEKMSAYVGDSRGLGRERARLKRWHKNRPAGLRSYTAMTDRLFSLGLERELDHKVLRIMTPFDDDTFNEYVSQIRRLLESGYELRLLTRHTKEHWEWKRLQRNLLSEIKEHRDRITVRTYSRFKEYQRVSPEMDFRDLGEIGIHGKLQTIGNPGEGAALLGSANFMENSYDWNPECGVYTEQTQFVRAAIEFFDIVWDISEADEVAIDRLQEIPNRKLVPTYYS